MSKADLDLCIGFSAQVHFLVTQPEFLLIQKGTI